MKTITVQQVTKCDLCSGIAHYDAPTHQGPWGFLCEICMSTDGIADSSVVTKLVHTSGCKECCGGVYYDLPLM